MLRRDTTNYLNEPYVTGGNPVLADSKVLFNDMLGTTQGSVDNGKYNPINTTTFGDGDTTGFFTGKPHVAGLGYNFLFRNYKPELSKWQTSDPLGYPDGWNNLAYVNNMVTGTLDWLGGETTSLSQNFDPQSQYAYLLGTYYSSYGTPPNNINCTAIFALSLESGSFSHWQSGSCISCSFQIKYEKEGEQTQIYNASASASASVVKSGSQYIKQVGGSYYYAQDYSLAITTTMSGVPAGTYTHTTSTTYTVLVAE